jgi:hypothetical protein
MLNEVSIPFDGFPNAENKRVDLVFSGHRIDPVACAVIDMKGMVWRPRVRYSDLWILYHQSLKQGR